MKLTAQVIEHFQRVDANFAILSRIDYKLMGWVTTDTAAVIRPMWFKMRCECGLAYGSEQGLGMCVRWMNCTLSVLKTS
jgi:hypothetical protein